MMKSAVLLLAATASATSVNHSRRQLQDTACADLNADGAVNVSDLLTLLAAYGTSADGDTNGDGVTDVADLLALLAAYGASNQCSPSGGGQPITFGSIAFESRNCEYDATASAAGYIHPDDLFDQALAAFSACPQPAGFCTATLNSGIELSNRGVCGSGGDGAYAAGWNGFASAGGPDVNENIGFHIVVPFTVDAAGSYTFRMHLDFGRGGFIGIDEGRRFTPGDFWGHYQLASTAMTQGDHVFEALGFEGCCDGHAELEVHLPCDGVSDPWRVVQAGASSCMTCLGGIGASFSAFKFNLDPDDSNTGLRNWAGANSIQLSEITLYDPSGTPLRDGITCTNPGGNNPAGELPEHACNGLTENDPNGCNGCANSGHKWLDFNKGDLVMTFTDTVTVGSWDWQTANDAPARDPTKWSLQGSNDGTTWQDIDTSYATEAFATTDARFTWQGPFQIAAGSGADASCADPRGHSAGQMCPDGEEWNPLLATCSPAYVERGCLDGTSGDTTTYDTIFSQPLSPTDKSVVFTVRAGNDAHLGFFGDAQSNNEVYEIVLSGWGNTMSTIRPCNQCDNSYQGEGADGGRLPTPGLLSATEDRTFWATANYGLVVVGTGGDIGTNELMRWQDPEFHEPVYVGIMTGWGSTGAWSVCATGWVSDSCTAFGTPGVTYRRWNGITGVDVASFLAHDRYVNNPADVEDVFMNFFEAPVNVCDDCGTEMEAWYRAAETGPHTFRISADDNAHLWFGDDVWASGAGDEARQIASVPGWSGNREWNKYPEQTAAPIDLVEGRYYYMRAIANEGGGGDNLEVGVDTPTRTYNPIPVCTGSGALLFAQATGVRCNRWNGITGTGVEELLNHGLGASNIVPNVAEIKLDFFEAPINVCDDCGTEMTAYLLAPVTGTYTFRVSADDNAHLWFGGGPSEPTQQENQIASVPGWTANREWNKYPEQTAAPMELTAGTYYYLRAIANEGGGGDNLEVGVTIAGVGDFNPIPVTHPDVGPVLFFDGDFTPPPPPSPPCVADTVVGINYRRWEGIEGTTMQELLSHDTYLNNPPVADGDYPSGVYSELFEAPVNICDNCGTEMDGYFMPPQSGGYIFHLSADDNAALNLGPNVNEAMRREPIASVPGWSGNREWNKYPEQTSAPQQLRAGLYYYVRAVANEGGGGDNLEVGVTYPDGQSSKPSSVCFNSNIVWYPEAVGVKYMKWLGIDGGDVASLLSHANYNNNPPDEAFILQNFFEAPVNVCDACGTDMEAYFRASTTADHVFQISADDNAFLWVGASQDEAMGAAPIASVPGWTANREWNKYPEQQAAPMALTAGEYYYMRAIANEGGGGDNLEVGIANLEGMSPIPVFNADGSANLFTDYANAPVPASLGCPDNGNNGVTYRRWDGVGGTGVQDLLDHAAYAALNADTTVVFSDAEGSTNLFEAPVNVCDDCGTMMDGYFIANADGFHTFRISADDNAHLWFGATINEAMDSREIASVPGWSANREWNKYPEQTAAPLSLQAGKYYYMRAIANEGGGGDNLEVGVTFPDGTSNNPIKICDGEQLRFVTDARGVNYRRWHGIAGVTMDEVLLHAHYSESPDVYWVALDFFETPSNVCDDCASELDGWFTPTADGDHVFQLAADDYSHLWFGISEPDAMGRDPIANVPGWTGAREWNKYAEQQAAPITLTAGTPYFLRATANEGGGGDNLCVGVTGASGELLPIPVTTESGVVLLTWDAYVPPPPPAECTVDGPVGITYRRWEGIDGDTVAAMLDSASYQSGVASADVTEVLQIFETPVNVCDNCGSELEGYFRANENGPHTFRISADDNAHLWFGETISVAVSSPEIASVPGWSDSRQWNKYPEQTAAPITLSAGSLYYIRAVANEGGGGDNLALGVTTPSQTMNPMEACVNSITYLYTDSVGVNYKRWNGIDGTGVAELLNHANFNNNPADLASTLMEFFEAPINVCDNCGTMMDAYFKATTSGDHTFRISADDNAHLWFGASIAEAMASPEIASVPGWSGNREWNKYPEQTALPISLTAGQLYYMRAVANEGGGGDNLEVGVTTPTLELNPIPVVGADGTFYLYTDARMPPPPPLPCATTGLPGVTYRRWNGVDGTDVEGFLAHPNFNGNPPDVSEILSAFFEAPINVCDNCGTEMEAWFRPAVTGAHTFRISADDNAHLWFGENFPTAMASAEIASVPGWSGNREWNKYPEQTAAPIDLVAGKYYYMRAVANEGGGGDNLEVGVTTPTVEMNPIKVCGDDGNSYLMANAVGVYYQRWNGIDGGSMEELLNHPSYVGGTADEIRIFLDEFEAPVNICDNCGTEMHTYFKVPQTGEYTFRISADDNAHLWFGATMAEALAADPIASVPGWTANREWNKYAEQTAAPVVLNAGDSFFMRATANEGGGGDNLEVGVTLAGVGDFNPIPVMHPADPTIPLLVFDGDMSPPPPAPLPCAANAQDSQYISAAGGINWRKWDGIGGTDVQQLLDAGVVGGAGTPPTDSDVRDLFEAPVNICDNCGTEMDGWFRAAATGPHTFLLSADDNAHLWFGETVHEAVTASPIANVPGWSGNREWTKYPEQTAAPVELQAGRMYYIRAIANEGGGGDNLEVGVQAPADQGLLPIPACSAEGNQYLFSVAAGVTYRRWNGIGGTAVADLLNHANYNGNPPDVNTVMTRFFEAPVNVCDECGTEMEAYFVAPADGSYQFQISADDNAFLWIGASLDAAMASEPVASVPGWSANRQWDKYPEQQAAAVSLVAGSYTYIRAVSNEGGGGDNLEVGIANIEGMSPIPVISADGAVLLVIDYVGAPIPADLPCQDTAAPGVTYRRWDGITGVGVAELLTHPNFASRWTTGCNGAHQSTLEDFEVAQAICTSVGARLCSAAELAADEARGTGCGHDDQITWTSDTCAGGHVTADGDSRVQANYADPQCREHNFNAAVRCCATGASLCASLNARFGGWPTVNTVSSTADVCGESDNGLGPPLFSEQVMDIFEAPVNVCDDCGTELEAYFMAPETGDYIFRISADDNAHLWFGETMNIAMQTMEIASVPGWSANRQWNKYIEQTAAPRTLQAGQKYYLRAVANEGGGGDNLEVGVTTPGRMGDLNPIPVCQYGITLLFTEPIGVIYRRWDGIGGSAVAELLNHDSFNANPPNYQAVFLDFMEAPVNVCDECGTELEAWFIAPVSGPTIFRISADDNAHLWFGSDPASAVAAGEIASVPGWSANRQWDKYPEQTAAPLDLVGGQAYYLRAVSNEGGGGDNCEVGVTLPGLRAPNLAQGRVSTMSSEGWGGAAARAVDGNRDGAWGGNSCTHSENGAAEWWQVDLGASAAIDHVDLFHRTDCCQDRLGGAQVVVSDTADYSSGTVCGDVDVVAVSVIQCGGAQGQFVTVTHSNQYITICEAEVYAVGGVAEVVAGGGASLNPIPVTMENGAVLLKFDGDFNPAPSRPVCSQDGMPGVNYRRWEGVVGDSMAAMLASEVYASAPTYAEVYGTDGGLFESPTNVCDNCATEMDGWFIPNEDGHHTFRLAADDNAYLWFGETYIDAMYSDPIASVPGWSGVREWNKYATQTAAPIYLVAGRPYFIRMAFNEGGGGDNGAVGVTTPSAQYNPIRVCADGTVFLRTQNVGVNWRLWNGITGTAVVDLLGHTNYNNNPPDQVDVFDIFESPTNICDDCGTEMDGWFVVADTGEHTWKLAADDNSFLWVGANVDEAIASDPVAAVPGWSGVREWDKYAEQTSAPIQYTAGDYVFVRAVANEGGGGDNLAVGVITPAASLLPIPAADDLNSYLFADGTWVPPPAALPCADTGNPGIAYRRWDGIDGDTVEGLLSHDSYNNNPPNVFATMDIFEAPINVCDSCGTEMQGYFRAAESGPHTFRISADDNAHLWFGLSQAAAMSAPQIASVPGWSANRQWDKYPEQTAQSIELTEGYFYYIRAVANEGGGGDNLEVGVSTPSVTMNPIQSCNAGNSYLFADAVGVNYRRWAGIAGATMDELLSHAHYSEGADVVNVYMDFFESPTNICDNCGTEMDGWFVPSASGEHIFQLAADDYSYLWFGVDEASAMAAEPIASVPGWTGVREWNKYGSQQAAPLALTAGTYYFLRATANEGGGGDNLCVGVTGASGDMLPIPVKRADGSAQLFFDH